MSRQSLVPVEKFANTRAKGLVGRFGPMCFAYACHHDYFFIGHVLFLTINIY